MKDWRKMYISDIISDAKFANMIEGILEKDDPTITSIVAPLSEGSVHDFYSNGDYWHPDPSKPDGLPYIRRDGIQNPENFNDHRAIMTGMVYDLRNLYAWYLEKGDARCLQKIEAMLKCFFISEETRMNPSLNYAQAIPGVCPGRSIGLIDTLHLIDVPVLLKDMRKRGVVSDEIYDGVSSWCNEYVDWLMDSEFGKTEAGWCNNHAITCHVQYAAFSLFSPRRAEIEEKCISFFKNNGIGVQMAEDGSLPEELLRTKPYSYSLFAYDNLVNMACLVDSEDLFSYEDAKGRSLSKGLEFILPFIKNKSLWTYGADVENFEKLPVGMPFMFYMAEFLDDESLVDLYFSLPRVGEPGSEVYRNVAVKMPWLYGVEN